MMGHGRSQERRGWHIGKEIPVALLLTMAVQTGMFIWWLATLSGRVDTQGKDLLVIRSQVDVLVQSSAAGDRQTALNKAEADALRRDVSQISSNMADVSVRLYRIAEEQARLSAIVDRRAGR